MKKLQNSMINQECVQAPTREIRADWCFETSPNSKSFITFEETSKRRLNTDRILPKSKRNHNIIQSWQSFYKRWYRNPHNAEYIVGKIFKKELTNEIDKQIIEELVALFGKPL